MPFESQYVPYQNTGAFSKIIIDYLEQVPELQSFYQYKPAQSEIETAVKNRKKFPINRKVLADHFRDHYANADKITSDQIRKLEDEDTFTVCTAHQPNIFTGHLYFIYKILHTIRLANDLNENHPGYHFVPVFYMGSEDADLEELGEISIHGKKYRWNTKQAGAVGRMLVDKELITLIDEMQGQLSVEPHGEEIITIIRSCYTPGKTIERATFEFVNILFSGYGLLVLLPDTPELKREFIPIVKKELEEQFSNKVVSETIKKFPEVYKVQAAGRELNLFYLNEGRERIEAIKRGFGIANTKTTFNSAEMMEMVDKHPERISPNVILRPVYQELILPNIAFIGGGGELAYWLELRDVFEASDVHFPMLILRNSFMIIPAKTAANIKKLSLSPIDFFKHAADLVNGLVKRDSKVKLRLEEEKKSLQNLYNEIRLVAEKVDPTLEKHVSSLSMAAVKRIESLEKKMLKAERKKFEAEQRQVKKIKDVLFPGGVLQERVDNVLPYYAVYGKGFIRELYNSSRTFEMVFCIMEEKV